MVNRRGSESVNNVSVLAMCCNVQTDLTRNVCTMFNARSCNCYMEHSYHLLLNVLYKCLKDERKIKLYEKNCLTYFCLLESDIYTPSVRNEYQINYFTLKVVLQM